MAGVAALVWWSCLFWLALSVGGRETSARQQELWKQTILASQPDHWYQFEVDDIKDGAPDSGTSAQQLNGTYSGTVEVAQQGLVGRAITLTGGRSAVRLATGPKLFIDSHDWTLSFLLLNYGTPEQPSEELMRENVQYNEVGTSALKLRQFRVNGKLDRPNTNLLTVLLIR